ncbi:hypothetical protein TTHERM_00241989 (macronuclear) [Tetrahymena thermophila SB210]|uniref:Tetratricopeptide repeat protein n=1 Tax=Tetrahymena thermophila (strain SB210) TaxID=312017 RepID=A4VCV3_TETTS|nr:hypothetical protein TTHERM_00241989 [Tetrahymena thermophila SB210]EDK31363.1 hypothetical protein TTHERM_00241989 [Tetrahymena thermophila SB210]|eukprot:XP_001471036.1 hypothetical protein TTHERM_00241989 [Tetrahymena thermophila SB210]
MSFLRNKSQPRLASLSKINPQMQALNQLKKYRMLSMDNSPINSYNKIDQPGFLPSILPTNNTLPLSTKSKKSSVDNSIFTNNSIIHSESYARKLKKKSLSTQNIHDQFQYLNNSQLSNQQQNAKNKQSVQLLKNKNYSQINISNASTLNVSQNNSKQDFSIMLNEYQNSKLTKNAINNSYLSSSIAKSLNSSRLYANNSKMVTEQKIINFESELQKMINMYNNNQTHQHTESDNRAKAKDDSLVFEEDSIFANQIQTDSINDKEIASRTAIQRRDKLDFQKQQTRLRQMDALHLEYKMLLSEIQGDIKKDNLFNIMNSIIELSEKSFGNSEFLIKNYCLYADICRDIGDFNKSVQLLHHARLISTITSKYQIKLQLYKKVSEILSQSGQNEKALVYLKKMLRLSWKLKNDDVEIEAYDLIGKVLMLLGEVDLADFFHQKSMNNDKELADSPLRIAGEIGVKVRIANQQINDNQTYKSDSDDDLDLQSFPKSKQDEHAMRSEILKQQKKQQYFSLPKIVTNYGKRYQSIGRVNLPSYIREELEIKVSQRLSHMSQNRDLKNFYVYTYKNQNFWIKDGDFNQQQRFYVLKKNYNKHRSTVSKIVKELIAQQFKNMQEVKQILETDNIKILNPDILQ